MGCFPNNGPETSSRNAKENFDKRKDRQTISRQTSLAQFMSIKEGFSKKVTFNMIDKLIVMMGKLVMEDKGQNRPFKLQIYQPIRGRGQTRCNYDQRRFEDRFRPNNAYRDGQDIDKTIEVGQDMILIMEVATAIIQEVIKDVGDWITIRRGNFRNQNYNRNRSRSYERQNRDRRDGRITNTIDQGQV